MQLLCLQQQRCFSGPRTVKLHFQQLCISACTCALVAHKPYVEIVWFLCHFNPSSARLASLQSFCNSNCPESAFKTAVQLALGTRLNDWISTRSDTKHPCFPRLRGRLPKSGVELTALLGMVTLIILKLTDAPLMGHQQ